MKTTITFPYQPHEPPASASAVAGTGALFARYEEIAWAEDLQWNTSYRKQRLLGAGSQGAVYLAERQGADDFVRQVALKVFSPETYPTDQAYQEDMARVAQVSGRVAVLQCDNVVDIHDFIEWSGIRLIVMEWLDGYDLREVLSQRMLDRTQATVSHERWEYVNRVILPAGASQARLKPGVAIAVLRDCLAGLAALHHAGIVHGDLKPGNVMLTRTGCAKIIDIGSSTDLRRASPRRVWSPAYAAPEVLRGGGNTPRSDLASLGYVLIEMLAGRPVFEGLTTWPQFAEAKAVLDRQLPDLLPPEVS